VPRLGLIAILVLLTASEERFAETHRRRYSMWRSTRERLFCVAAITFCFVAGLYLFARAAGR
jgi:hypothetical protein